MAQPTSTGQKIQSSPLFVARVNESKRARNEKMAISLAFTLATNKAVLVGWAIGEEAQAPTQNWSQG